MALDTRLQEIQKGIRTALAARLKGQQRRKLLLDWLELGDNVEAGRLIWRRSGLVRLGKGPDATACLRYAGIGGEDDAYVREHLGELLAPLLSEEFEAALKNARAECEAEAQRRLAQCRREADERVEALERVGERCRQRCEELARTQHPVFRFRLNWVYLGLFLVIAGFVAWVVWLGWAEKPEVSIDFNVGEIIAGLLAGAGALLAGGAYAAKTLAERGG